MTQLNDKARRILDYITKEIGDGVPPSVREICAALQIKSTSTVHKYLKELEEGGYIVREENLNRAIRLPGSSAVKVPLLGTVTAGQPILAVEEIEEYIPFQTKYGDGSDLFALHVRGESMINAGILDGDVIVARRTTTALQRRDRCGADRRRGDGKTLFQRKRALPPAAGKRYDGPDHRGFLFDFRKGDLLPALL